MAGIPSAPGDQTPALNLPDPGEHLPYTVLTQEPRQDLVGNRFVDLIEVTYQSDRTGVVDHVQVPQRDYDPATVDRMIEDKLHKIEAVHALGAVPHPDNGPQ